jgi:hypothetical protein
LGSTEVVPEQLCIEQVSLERVLDGWPPTAAKVP